MLNQWLVTLFFSLSLCASSSWALAADASDEAGWLSEIRGTPTINVAQPQGGRIARVEAGDSIVTRDGDFVELGLGPKAFLRIGGNSRLNVNSTKPVEMKFEITGGTVIVDAFKLEEKKQSVKIATQAGEISLNRPALVRLDVSTDGAVQVLVQEGVVEWLRSGQGEVSLKSGFQYRLQLTQPGSPQQSKLERGALDEIDRWSSERSTALRGESEGPAEAYQRGQSIAAPRKAVTMGGGSVRASAEAAKHSDGAIRLHVVDSEGRPLQNVESRAQNLETKQVSSGPKDKRGEVRFEDVALGKYQVYAQKKGYLTSKSRVIEVGEKEVEVSLTVPKEDVLRKIEEEGRVAFEAQDYQKALEKYQTALAMVPWEIPMRQNVMLALVRLNQSDKAREVAREALAYEPEEYPLKEKQIMSSVSFEEGKVFMEQRKFDKAQSSFTEALKGDPNNGQIHYGLALAYGHRGIYPEAMKHIDEAIRLSPGEASYVEVKKMIESNAEASGK